MEVLSQRWYEERGEIQDKVPGIAGVAVEKNRGAPKDGSSAFYVHCRLFYILHPSSFTRPRSFKKRNVNYLPQTDNGNMH